MSYHFRGLTFQQLGSDRNTDHDTKVKLFSSETNFKIIGYLTFTEFTKTITHLWNLSLNNTCNYLILLDFYYILLIMNLIKIITEPLL